MESKQDNKIEANVELLHQILKGATGERASDIFFIKEMPLSFKVNGTIVERGERCLNAGDTESLVKAMYVMADNRDFSILKKERDDDFAFSYGEMRFRANTFVQKGAYCAVLRALSVKIPNPQKMNIPEKIINYAKLKNGLILITGETGSGKSTTQACLIDYINTHMNKHIITLEDPVEYVHPKKKSLVTQREIFTDSNDFSTALKASLRQCPDVILVGEMRDLETIEVAMSAAETGHLVISTLHTMDAVNAVGRIIDAFPKDQAAYIATLLSSVLRCVVFQQLIHDVNGNLIPLFEILDVTDPVRTLVQDASIKGLRNFIDQSPKQRYTTLDCMLIRLYAEGKIDEATVYEYGSSHKREWLETNVNAVKRGSLPDYLQIPL